APGAGSGPGRRGSGHPPGVTPDAGYVLDLLDLGDQPAELLQPVDLHGHQERCRALGLIDLDVGPGDVQLLFRDHRGDVAQEPFSVEGVDADGHGIGLGRAPPPLHLDEALRLVLLEYVLTIGPMDVDPLAAGDVADDRIAGDRLTAGGDAGEEVAD